MCVYVCVVVCEGVSEIGVGEQYVSFERTAARDARGPAVWEGSDGGARASSSLR